MDIIVILEGLLVVGYFILTVIVMVKVLKYIKSRERHDFNTHFHLAKVCEKNGDKIGAKNNYNAALYYLSVTGSIKDVEASEIRYKITKSLKELE